MYKYKKNSLVHADCCGQTTLHVFSGLSSLVFPLAQTILLAVDHSWTSQTGTAWILSLII